MQAYLLNLVSEPMIDQSKDTSNIEFGDPTSFIGVTYRNMDVGAEISKVNCFNKAFPGVCESL